MTVVKKYGNRRLYDTADSRYITLEELAAKIRGGTDVRVIDAKSGNDLTQATLAQIVMESRGASRLLPNPLLFQLIRMGDDALADFLGRYVGAALEMYQQARQSAQSMAPYNPFASMGFGADAFARMLGGAGWPGSAAAASPAPATPQQSPGASDVAELRRELEELKQSLRRKPKR